MDWFAGLYVFADKFDISALRATVMQSFLDHWVDYNLDSIPNVEQVAFVVERLPASSALYKLYVELYATRSWVTKSRVNTFADLGNDFVMAVMHRQSEFMEDMDVSEVRLDYRKFLESCRARIRA